MWQYLRHFHISTISHYRQILAKSACTCYLDMTKSLVSFCDLDLIFKVITRHKLKYLSKIMTSVPNLLNQMVNLFGFTQIYFMGKIMSLLVTLKFLLWSRPNIKMPNANLYFKLLHNNWCGSIWFVNILTSILIYAQEKELFKCRWPWPHL